MNGKILTIRCSERRKNKLYLYADQKDKTITALIEEWIDSLALEKERETTGYIMSDRLTIISRSGRVFEIVNYWQVLLVNPPLQKSRLLDRT